MSAPSWLDPRRWEDLLNGAACPFCVDGPRGVIADLGTSTVTMDEAVNVRGYCCVIPKEHAVELHLLSAGASFSYWSDVRRVSAAVQRATGAIKINYEVHGNVIPHVHMHIIPRYAGDAMETTGLAFAKLTASPYREGEFDRVRSQIISAIGAS
jgi:diadenosine tetraphosphate (Ap4A) HIT family hydrolase